MFESQISAAKVQQNFTTVDAFVFRATRTTMNNEEKLFVKLIMGSVLLIIFYVENLDVRE